MKMTKQTKMLLGVGVVGVAAYLIWKQNQKPKQNFFGRRAALIPVSDCVKGYTATGGLGYICCDPRYTAPTATEQECTGGKPVGKNQLAVQELF
jgi:hypothetical protein